MITPVFISRVTDAQYLGTRSITLSTTKAGVQSNYNVSWVTDASGGNVTVGGVVIEFCDNDPIPGGGACTAPTGLNTMFASGLTDTSQVGMTGFSVDTSNSTVNKVILTNGTPPTVNAGTTVSFTLGGTGIVNPTTANHTFYARIATYDTSAHAVAYTSSNIGTGVRDKGGIALSTEQQIVITSKVQERLTFCVYSGACSDNGTVNLLLGNTNGILDSTSGAYVDKTTKFDIGTNANGGAAVTMKAPNTLKSGTNSITAIGSTASFISASASTAQFGMCVIAGGGLSASTNPTYFDATCTGANVPQSSGTGAPTANPGSAKYGFNDVAAASATGDTVGTKPNGAGNSTGNLIAFMAKPADSTPAGIYQTTITLIATGAY